MNSKHLHHLCIQTNAYDASMKFYRDVLEFRLVKETKGFHGRDYNTWLALGSFMIELQTPKVEGQFQAFNKETEGIAHFCLYVDDFDNEYQRIKGLYGDHFLGKNGSDIYQVENGSLFKLKAPEGTIIEIRDNMSL